MRTTWLLGGAIAGAVALALIGVRGSNSAGAEQGPRALLPTAPAEVANGMAPNPADALEGEVLETLPVAKYTYLRLATAAGEVWAAVPSATIALHSHVQIAAATRMDDFASSTLKRTFKVIYFGTLGGPAPSGPAQAPNAAALRAVSDDEPLPPGHPSIGSADNAGNTDSLPPGHPNLDEAAPFDAPGLPPTLAAHAAPASEAALPDPPNQRAPGKNGYLVAELVLARSSLAGRRVRVRGEVTKVTDVQGHAFFHIRDSSLGPDGRPADLAVTSASRPARGDIATFEGVLRADVDIGIGYAYPALLENATLSGE